MKKALELKLLDMCEELMPWTKVSDNTALKKLLKDIRKDLESG